MAPRSKVFLDANVVIQAGAPPGGPLLTRVLDLVKAGVVDVITTDLTILEVAKKHTENEYDVVKDVGSPHFRRLVHEHFGAQLPERTKAQIKDAIREKTSKAVSAMFRRLKAKTLKIDSIKPSAVFFAYTRGEGFFSGEGKKDQFPDAIIYECVRQEASEFSPLIIVANDKDFQVPVKGTDHVSLVKTIPELFKALDLEVDAPQMDRIEAFLEENTIALRDAFDEEIRDWILDASDVEDADIEVKEVKDVELGDDLICFRSVRPGGEIIVAGTAEILANVSYTHPDWDTASYDSEDKVLIPWDTAEGETEVRISPEFSMSISVDKKGRPSKIKSLKFTDDKFIYVTLRSIDEY